MLVATMQIDALHDELKQSLYKELGIYAIGGEFHALTNVVFKNYVCMLKDYATCSRWGDIGLSLGVLINGATNRVYSRCLCY